MNILLTVSFLVVFFIFLKRMFVGPQKLFATAFMGLLILGVVSGNLAPEGSYLIYVSGLCLLLAPLFGIWMLTVDTLYLLRNAKENQKKEN